MSDLEGVEPVIWPMTLTELYQAGYKSMDEERRLRALAAANRHDELNSGSEIGAAMMRGYMGQYALDFVTEGRVTPATTRCDAGDYLAIELQREVIRAIGGRIGVRGVLFTLEDVNLEVVVSEPIVRTSEQAEEAAENIAHNTLGELYHPPRLTDEQPFAVRAIYEHTEAHRNYRRALHAISGNELQL